MCHPERIPCEFQSFCDAIYLTPFPIFLDEFIGVWVSAKHFDGLGVEARSRGVLHSLSLGVVPVQAHKLSFSGWVVKVYILGVTHPVRAHTWLIGARMAQDAQQSCVERMDRSYCNRCPLSL